MLKHGADLDLLKLVHESWAHTLQTFQASGGRGCEGRKGCGKGGMKLVRVG